MVILCCGHGPTPTPASATVTSCVACRFLELKRKIDDSNEVSGFPWVARNAWRAPQPAAQPPIRLSD